MRSNWTIGKKLIVSFIAVALVTLLLGGVGFYGVREGERQIQETATVKLPAVDDVLTIRDSLTSVKVVQRTLLDATQSPDVRKRQYDNLAKTRERYEPVLKHYEALPKSGAEADAWKTFQSSLGNQRAANSEFVRLCQDWDKTGIQDPVALEASMQSCMAGHFKVKGQALEMLHSKQAFEGGEDATQCALGKWLAGFQTDNAEVRAAMQQVVAPHNRFHAAIRQLKAAAAANDQTAMADAYDKELVPATVSIVEQLDSIQKQAALASAQVKKARDQSMGECRKYEQEVDNFTDKLVGIIHDGAATEAVAATHQASVLKTISILALVVGVLTCLALGVLISRSINRSLNQIASTLGEGSEQVASASAQVSAAGQSLAQGASEQAAALEETSSSLEEMSSMTKKNAETAHQASTLSADAKHAADSGNQAMQKMNSAIKEIEKSAGETAKIIKVIDEIAFQTNLLALNAAVEAARAGEAGKGFAVVAEEVRNLAMRSAEAAKNTAAMIEESVNNAKNGVAISNEVAKVLEEITASNTKVNGLVGEIAAASQEQSTGIDQVNTAVSQMDKVTQSNAANAEESASAAEELSAQAESMKGVVEELLVLVGGTARGGDSAIRRPLSQSHAMAARKPAVRTQHAPASPGKAKALPKAAIPLDDSETRDSHDFSEFNVAA